MNKNSKILITGSKGMVGKNLVEELKNQGYENLIFIDYNTLNLIDREKVFNFFKKKKPEYVFHIAAKVGGIKNNLENPVEFLRDNLLINTNVIDACFNEKVKKLIILNSATIYSSKIKYPKEEDLFRGPLEPENEAYGLSKIYAIKLCEYYNKEYGTNFINLATTNIYGKYSKFDLNRSNVIAALLIKFHDAKVNKKEEVVVWGTGKARREFIYARDLSKLMILAGKKIDKSQTVGGLLNCGLNDEFSIKDLAMMVKKVVQFKGKVVFDNTKPEGVKRRAINSFRINNLIKLERKTPLEKGVNKTYEYFLETKK